MIATTIRAAGFAQPILELDTCWQASRENQHRILVMKLALSGPVRFISCVNVVSYGCRPHQNLSLNEIFHIESRSELPTTFVQRSMHTNRSLFASLFQF